MKRWVCRFALITSQLFVVVAPEHASASDAINTANQPHAPITSGPSDTARLDLGVVLQRVLDRNPTIGAARAVWAEAQARARQAGALEDPMLDVMAAPRSFGSSDVDAAYRVAVTQPFPIFGQRGLRRQATEADSRAAAWDLRTAQLDLLHEARTTFLDYWRVSRAIALNRELLGIMPELRRISLAKYSAGLAGQQEPLQIETELAMLDHQAVILDRQRVVAAARLNVLMHEPAEDWLPPPPDDLPIPDTTVVHADLAPKARALRPELRAADARVEAGQVNVTLARRQSLPATSFGIGYDRFWMEPELRLTAGMTLNLPLNFGRVSAARAEARARLEESRKRREIVEDSIQLQVATAAASLHEHAHDLRIARERMLPLAERALKASRASYEANRADLPMVLNSLRVFLTARLQADEALTMLHEARADLDRALGETPSVLQREKLP